MSNYKCSKDSLSSGSPNNASPKNSSRKKSSPNSYTKFPVTNQGPHSPYHSYRWDINDDDHVVTNMIENDKERKNEVDVADALNRREIGPRELEDRKNKSRLQEKLLDDYIKSNDMTRQEKNKFLRFFELGIYYIRNGKIHIDNKKFQELQHLNNSNTKFDQKVERKAYKAYNKYSRKRYGYKTYHNSEDELRIKRNQPDLYEQIERDKDQFIKNFKSKYEKKRQRYIKKQFKKKYRFNKWKNKYGYTL